MLAGGTERKVNGSTKSSGSILRQSNSCLASTKVVFLPQAMPKAWLQTYQVNTTVTLNQLMMSTFYKQLHVLYVLNTQKGHLQSEPWRSNPRVVHYSSKTYISICKA